METRIGRIVTKQEYTTCGAIVDEVAGRHQFRVSGEGRVEADRGTPLSSPLRVVVDFVRRVIPFVP